MYYLVLKLQKNKYKEIKAVNTFHKNKIVS